jgi:hypothetical protein
MKIKIASSLFVSVALTLSVQGIMSTKASAAGESCPSGSGCTPPSYGSNPSTPTPTTNPGTPSNGGGNGCGAGGCGGPITLPSNPVTTSNQQSSQTNGFYNNSTGGSTSAAFNFSDGGNNNLFGCSAASPELGGFATANITDSSTNGYYNFGGSSFSGGAGVYARVPLNGREREICQLHGTLTTVNAEIRMCQELGKQGVRAIPLSFANMHKGKSMHERALLAISACNEFLTTMGMPQVQLPPVVDQTPPTPAYIPQIVPTPQLPAKN